MHKKLLIGLILMFLLASSVSITLANETDFAEDYPWRNHQAPFDFKFGNMIDSHQQSFLYNAGEKLKGFIYIHNIEEDYSEGIPTAEKAHCPTGSCMVGWVVKGVRISATLVNKSPRIWLVDESDIPIEPGYSHFHWTGLPKSPHDLVIGEVYEGYLMKRIAPAPFFWLGGPGSGGEGGGGGGGGCDGHDDGGCSDSTHDDGSCNDGTHDDDGCNDGTHDDDDGCSGGDGGSHGGSQGRLVPEGVDSHSNIITSLDQPWHSDCHDD